jgi:non-heme chloroperoxidase
MPRFTSPFDGAQLFYRDYNPASSPAPWQPNQQYINKSLPTLVFLHGWPFSSLMFEHLMLPLCESYGIRCIAPDRRGFGSSDWTGPETTSPISYEVFADDTIHLLEKLNVGPFVFVASSMGPGESVLAHSRSAHIQKNCKVRCSRNTGAGKCQLINFLGVCLDWLCHAISYCNTG